MMDRHGLSPVWSTILLIIATCAIAAIMGIAVSGLHGGGYEEPIGTVHGHFDSYHDATRLALIYEANFGGTWEVRTQLAPYPHEDFMYWYIMRVA